MSLSELMIDIPAEHEANVFGQFDAYAKKLERTFHVTLIARDGSMKIVGENTAAEKTHRVLTQLLELSRRGNTITEQNVDYAISLVFEDQEEGIVEIDRVRLPAAAGIFHGDMLRLADSGRTGGAVFTAYRAAGRAGANAGERVTEQKSREHTNNCARRRRKKAR